LSFHVAAFVGQCIHASLVSLISLKHNAIHWAVPVPCQSSHCIRLMVTM